MLSPKELKKKIESTSDDQLEKFIMKKMREGEIYVSIGYFELLIFAKEKYKGLNQDPKKYLSLYKEYLEGLGYTVEYFVDFTMSGVDNGFYISWDSVSIREWLKLKSELVSETHDKKILQQRIGVAYDSLNSLKSDITQMEENHKVEIEKIKNRNIIQRIFNLGFE